jgi:uncharacterized protein YndB with AHSA1/START domain
MTPTIDPSALAIERELDLAASPERVWQALTDSAELAAWFPQRAELPTRVGATGWMEWDGHPRFLVRIDAFEPERRLVWTWASSRDADFDASATVVEWTLEAAPGGGTTLRLRETGFDSIEARRGNVLGWVDELGELLVFLAREPWERGIRRTWHLRSDPAKVWRAFADASDFATWWGSAAPIEIEPGSEGWFEWEGAGRFAVRYERVAPPTYRAWRGTIQSGAPLAEAAEVLRTEWVVVPADGGGTDVHLLETGFRGPEHHGENTEGWDTLVAGSLGQFLGEDDVAAPTAG